MNLESISMNGGAIVPASVSGGTSATATINLNSSLSSSVLVPLTVNPADGPVGWQLTVHNP